jgi:tripartite-type tricarboxylate transporter receptor subunit TctC
MEANMKKVITSAFCLVLAAASFAAFGQESYPNKPVYMVVPSSPGGATDIVARAISSQLSAVLGKTVVVDNKPGASGTIGAASVVRAAPDGYTLLMAPAPPIVVVPHYRKIKYNPLKDLAPVTLVATSPNMVVVNPKVPVNSIKELIALAKTKPESLNYGSSGYGAPSGLAGEVFNKLVDIHITQVPFKGAGPATEALLGGHIQLMFSPITVALPYVKDHRLKALGVTSKERSKAAPDVPTLIESGVNEDVVSFYGVLAPAHTPQPIIDKLQSAIVGVLMQPKIKEFFERNGAVPVGNTPAQFGDFIREQYAKFGKIVKEVGVGDLKK